jgi:uroporphyrinogen III methyltransferase/synthase
LQDGASENDAAHPLQGLTFLNTRDAASAPALTRALERLGGRVIERPTIAFGPPGDWADFDRAAADLRDGQWAIFTSATAVRFTLARLAEIPPTLPSPLEGEGRAGPELAEGVGGRLAACRLAAVGPGTASALARRGLNPALVPERFQGEGLLEALRPKLQAGEPVWHPRAEAAREVLDEGLRAAGAALTVSPCYRTMVPAEGLGPVPDLLRARQIDWLCFTSASTVRNFFALLKPELHDAARQGPRVACLGAITAEAARDRGLRVDALPERQDLAGLVQAIVDAVRKTTPDA